jgi:UTP-glucose-1-phosphate uridylyltransferase
VKETNLFFALPTLLALFPEAPVAVLTRSPLGVASSFTRGDLFRRWAYRGRYQQMVAATRSGHQARYRVLVPDDDPPDLVALVRLQVLNTVLLAAALTGRDIAVIPYETAVLCPQTAVSALAAVVPDLGVQPARRPPRAAGCSAAAAAEDTFVTTVPRAELAAFLSDPDAELVRATTAAALAAARTAVSAPTLVKASAWLAGDHLYILRPLSLPHARRTRRPAIPELATGPRPRFLRRTGLEWRNLLVSNAEFAAFLNELADAGLANSHAGTYLLACEMPAERGGRLHRDPATGRWHVSEGYEHHPAYWVTWIGAAAFAAWSNARLPTRAELIEVTLHEGAVTANADYQFGDVTPVTEPGGPADEIHHLVGNVQVWCCDGPSSAELHDGPAERWLYGAAWNTPSTLEEIHRARHRHLAGCSRGVGIRLVRDLASAKVPAAELAALLTGWITSLGCRTRSLFDLDQVLIESLGSETDVGLGSHIGPGAGESGQGQLLELLGETQAGQVGDLHELHAPDRPRVSALGDIPDGPASAPGLKGDVDDVGATGQVVADVQQPTDRNLDPCLLTHLPDQRGAEGLTFLDFPSGQRPGPPAACVLVEQKDVIVLDDDSGDPNVHALNLPLGDVAGRASDEVRVVLAAGGLGTRVHRWARYLPKEFYPVGGRPGIAWILDEIAGLGAGHIVIVYHPYYRAFAEWAGQAVSQSGGIRYRRAAGRPIADRGTAQSRAISFIAQHGRYGDLTSVLNGADHFSAADDLYVAFADNIYFGPNPLLALGALPPGQVAVVARPYQPELAAWRGVIATVECDGGRLVADLIEKPSPSAASALERRYGARNLLLHEGRARVTADFIRFARTFPIAPGVEPKLALAIGAYAAAHPVVAVETSCEVIDLGAPACRRERNQLPVAKTSARQSVTISDDPFLTES